MAVDATTPVGPNAVAGAIRKAAQATGTSFDYLLATARVESDLNPNLTMRSSTATGLFQFIDQTWLSTLKQAGPAFGYGHYADAITQAPSGRYVVADPALRNEIMQLRKDPGANALMGAVFTQQNTAVMASRLGRKPSEGELYIGHFFGPYAGAKAIALARRDPTANAAEIFPAAARANRPIFYDRAGNARSIAGVCAELMHRYQVARAQGPTIALTPQVAAQGVGSRNVAAVTAAGAGAPPAASGPATGTAAVLAFAADTGAAASPASGGPTAVRGDSAGGMFHSLFLVGERREAVSPAISELWSAQPRAPQGSVSVAEASPGQGASNNTSNNTSNNNGLLNLFRDPQ